MKFQTEKTDITLAVNYPSARVTYSVMHQVKREAVIPSTRRAKKQLKSEGYFSFLNSCFSWIQCFVAVVVEVLTLEGA